MSRITVLFILLIIILTIVPAWPVVGLDISTGLGYLKTNQANDGGFAEPGGGSIAGTTCLGVLGIIASGQDPKSWASAGGNPFDFLNGRAGTVSGLL
ncbi:MAG: hypothetical protein JW738_02640, partial [Actinobacteria bacterium]|nr:hypothetical protein [Actinomycetota bacterium]